MNNDEIILKPIRELKNPFSNDFEKFNKQKEFQLFERSSIFNKKHKQIIKKYNLAIKIISQNKYEKAKLILKEIIEKEKSFFPAWLNMGLLHAKSGALTMALECYNYAISFNPDYDIAFFNRAILYEKLEKYEMAIEDYKETINVNPDFNKARVSIYFLLEKLGKHENSKKYLDKITKIIPNSPFVYYLNYEFFLRKKDFQNAYSWLKKTKPFYPQNGDFFYTLGWLAHAVKDFSEALKYYDISLKFRPLDLESIYNLSIIKIKVGFHSDGIALFSNYLERVFTAKEVVKKLEHWENLGKLFPELPEIHMVIAEQYYSIGNIDRTLALLNKMKIFHREHLTSRVFLAEIYYDLGKYGESIKEWQNIILEFNDYLYAYNKLGQIYAMLGNISSAITIWKKAEIKFPDNHEIKYQLSLAYASEKEFEKAYEYIISAKKLKPDARKIQKRYKEIKLLVDKEKKRDYYK